jgi:hypothetical protein
MNVTTRIRNGLAIAVELFQIDGNVVSQCSSQLLLRALRRPVESAHLSEAVSRYSAREQATTNVACLKLFISDLNVSESGSGNSVDALRLTGSCVLAAMNSLSERRQNSTISPKANQPIQSRNCLFQNERMGLSVSPAPFSKAHFCKRSLMNGLAVAMRPGIVPPELRASMPR